MRDHPQVWTDRPDPTMEEIPGQRSAGEDVEARDAHARDVEADGQAEAGPDGHAGAGPDGHAEAGQAAEFGYADAGRGADEDRAIGVASVPEADSGAPAATDETRADERADEARADGARADEAGADEARADEARADEDAVSVDDGRLAEDREHRLLDNGDDDAVYRTDAESAGAAQERAGATGDAEEERVGEAPLQGGVPDDAVPSQDAPVPAAAYEAGSAEAAGEGTGGGELMPGDVPEQPVDAMFQPGVAEQFRDRWQRVQMQFVDDPHDAAQSARALVDDVFTALHESLTNQRGALDDWQSGQSGDTEQLRVAVRRYRDFLDKMLGL